MMEENQENKKSETLSNILLFAVIIAAVFGIMFVQNALLDCEEAYVYGNDKKLSLCGSIANMTSVEFCRYHNYTVYRDRRIAIKDGDIYTIDTTHCVDQHDVTGKYDEVYTFENKTLFEEGTLL